MERRRIIAMGVEGTPPLLPPDTEMVWCASGPNRGAVLIGLKERRENDAEQMLHLACDQPSSPRKAAIKEIVVDLDESRPSFDWAASFASELNRIEAGHTLVDPSLARVYDRLFMFEHVEEETGDFFLLRSKRFRPTRIRGVKPRLSKMVGRDPELSQMLEILEQSAEDQGQIAGIVGDAGIGKTRLIAAFKEEVSKRRIPCLEGTHPLQGTKQYEGFRQIVAALLGGSFPKVDLTQAEQDLLASLLNPGTQFARLTGMTEEQIRQGLFFVVRKILHETGKKPLVVILEDMHWADKASVDLLSYVMEGLESTHLLLVPVHRYDLKPTWDKRLNYNAIEIKPLVETETENLIREILGVTRVAPTLSQKLAKLTLGNPLFVEEVVRQMMDRETITIVTDDKRERLVRLTKEDEKLEVPATLHSLIAARFDRLESDLRESLKWASLLGTSFKGEELEGLLSQSGIGNSNEATGSLIEHGYLIERSVFPKRILQFSHDMIFETVRGSVSEAEARKRHTQIAKYLEQTHRTNPEEALERIAEHYLKSDDDERAVSCALKAGAAAEKAYQFQRALFFHREGKKRWEAAKLRVASPFEVYAPYVRLLLTVGDFGDVEAAFAAWQNAGVPDEPLPRGTFASLQLKFFNNSARIEDAFEASERALKAFGSDPSYELNRLEVIHYRVMALQNIGRVQQAVAEGLRALSSSVGDAFALARLRLQASTANHLMAAGEVEEARSLLLKTTNSLTPDLPVADRIQILRSVAAAYESAGSYEDSERALMAILKAAKDSSLPGEVTFAFEYLGIEQNEQGLFRQALKSFEEAIDVAKKTVNIRREIRSSIGIVDTLNEIGATKEALAAWDRIQPLVMSISFQYLLGINQSIRAYIFEQEGKIGDSIETSKRAEDLYRKSGLESLASRVRLQTWRKEAVYGVRPIHDVVADFNREMGGRDRAKWSFQPFQFKAVAFFLVACGGQNVAFLDPDVNPADAPGAWLKQLLYVAKIRWLDSVNRESEATALREEYRLVREEIAKHVPAEYREAFENHPIYRVP